MTTTSVDTTDLNERTLQQLRLQLSAGLPGLSDTELHSLAVRVGTELEYRVGSALMEGLSQAQLSEFEALTDSGDDDGCAQWLETNVPTYRVTVAKLRANLIAEVIDTVTTADPSAAVGTRDFAEVLCCSLDLIEEHLKCRDMKYSRRDGTMSVAFAPTQTQPALLVSIGLLRQDTDLLAITGTAPEVDFPIDAEPTLNTFAATWNRKKWLPKAVVSADHDSHWVNLMGEVAIPISRPVTRELIDKLIADAIAAMFALFRHLQSDVSGKGVCGF